MAEIPKIPTEGALRAGERCFMQVRADTVAWFSYEPGYDPHKQEFSTCFQIEEWRGNFRVAVSRHASYDEAVTQWQHIVTQGAIHFAKKALGIGGD